MRSQTAFLTAGFLYLAIILLGLGAEIGIRLPLAALEPGAFAATIATEPMPFRLSILADAAMVTADIALAVMLFLILSPVDRVLAGTAALFRLIQAAILGANLLNSQAALNWALAGDGGLAKGAFDLHAAGYDLGLIFFGINSVLTAVLLLRSEAFGNWLGWLIGAAGLVYLTGSGLRILSPETAEAFAPVYLVAVVAETAFAVALLTAALRSQSAPRSVGSEVLSLC